MPSHLPSESQEPTPSTARPLRVGPYRIEAQLGQGGMGEVFRAIDERLGRAVALKRIQPQAASHQARRRFRREARLAARLDHPRIVKIHDLLLDDGDEWIVQELLEGETLEGFLETRIVDLDRLLQLAIDVTSALDAAHRRGVVHRDLKLANVFVTHDGPAKVLDFGLAKQILFQDRDITTVTLDGHLVGTPHAMSPEQVLGHDIDLRSDLFSLGSLLYELFSGQAPFRAAHPVESLSRVCCHQPEPLDHVAAEAPRPLVDLVTALLEKEPAHRPADAGEVLETLSRIAEASHHTLLTRGRHRDAEPQTLVGETPATAARTPFSEQRQITVACCELVHPERGSGSLDPTVAHRSIERFEAEARRLAERYSGRIANILGHRVVLYFGYPQAHEDDALRAVRAALDLADAFGPTTRQPTEPAVRVGVDTGPSVVLGSASGTLQVAPGATLDGADQRMRSAAPHQVVTSERTRSLLKRGVDLAIAPRLVDGEERHDSFRVERSHETESGSWDGTQDRIPLVDRDQELATLEGHWRRVVDGRGRVVLLTGEAGIGKSRLVRELRRRLGRQAMRWLPTQGVSYAESTPFFPVIEWLRHVLDIRRDDAEATQLRRLEAAIEHSRLELAESVPWLATLLDLDYSTRYQIPTTSPGKWREQTLDVLVRFIAAQAAETPTVLLFEDLHWMDPSTLECLDRLAEIIDTTPLLLLATSRTEVPGRWTRADRLHLARLGGGGPAALIDHLAEGRALPDAVRQQILAKTDGVPLFVEELTRTLLESGRLVERGDRWELVGAIDDWMIPTTLRDSLAERLDRLADAKATAQLASVIGREFSFELLASISTDAVELKGHLGKLVDARLIQRRGFSSKPRYIFRHALIQDAAYASLLPADRRQIHLDVARAMDASPGMADQRPELLAHHWAAGGDRPRAIDSWERAGLLALGRSAHHESTQHFEHGLAMVDELPESIERERRELEMLSGYGAALVTVEGYGATKVETTFDRVAELCKRRGDTPQEMLWRLWPFFLVRGDREVAFRHLANFDLDHEDPVLRLVGHTANGMGKIFDGDFLATRGHLRVAADLYPRVRDALLGRQLADAGIYAQLYDGWCDWFLGRPADAKRKTATALVEAEAIGDLHIRVSALCFCSSTAHEMRDEAAVRRLARQCADECVDQGFPHWLGLSQIMLGWASRHDDPEGSVDQIRGGLDSYQATGARFPIVYWTTYLIETLLDHGRLDDGLQAIASVADLSRTSLDRFFVGEHKRLEAELLYYAGASRDAVESSLHASFESATARHASSLQLRTALSWARLGAGWDDAETHRHRLAEALDLFSNDDAFSEVQEARELLAGPPG